MNKQTNKKIKMEIGKIKSDLINIYKNYLSDTENKENKILAGEFYNKYKELDPILKPNIATAINNLVDLGFDTGVKKSRDEIKEILKELEDDIS